jgi:hypothetical protein
VVNIVAEKYLIRTTSKAGTCTILLEGSTELCLKIEVLPFEQNVGLWAK